MGLVAGTILGLLLAVSSGARAREATVAVAANFVEPLETLQKMFAEATEHELVVVSGSTGKLYAQIVNGAPFDVLLAADQERPAKLADEDQGEPSSVFTYAIGRLTLWSLEPGVVAPDGAKTLREGDFRHLAIANPDLAPYGLAAQQTLEYLGLWDRLQDRIVRGENIAQTFQMVESGNAELGFVALSYVASERNRNPSSRWDVPGELHEPIRQDAILLRRGAKNEAARAFLAFLKTPEAREVIERFGYAVGRVS